MPVVGPDLSFIGQWAAGSSHCSRPHCPGGWGQRLLCPALLPCPAHGLSFLVCRLWKAGPAWRDSLCKGPSTRPWRQSHESANLRSVSWSFELLAIDAGQAGSSTGPSPGLCGARLALSSGDRIVFWSWVLGKEAGESRSSDPAMFTRAGPLLRRSTSPFIGSPVNPLGLPEVQDTWTPGLAAALRPAGGHGQQVGQERGESLRCVSVSRSLHWNNSSCLCTLGISWEKS